VPSAFQPRVNPFKRSEDESVSGVGASACFTQRASRTEPYLELWCYNWYQTRPSRLHGRVRARDADIWRMARVDPCVVTRDGMCAGTRRMDDVC
jgi:hypothetical protein